MSLKQRTKGRYRVAGRKRLVGRELAALSFLQNVPMVREEQRIQEVIQTRGVLEDADGYSDHSGQSEEITTVPHSWWWPNAAIWSRLLDWLFGHREDTAVPADINHIIGEESDEEGLGIEDVWERPTTRDVNRKRKTQAAAAQPLENPLLGATPGVATEDTGLHKGRRLAGPNATVVQLPTSLRRPPGHTLGTVTPEAHSGRVRQWERETFHLPLMEKSRLFYSSSSGYPLITSSIIRFDPSEEENRRRRQKLLDQRSLEVYKVPKRDWRGLSFAHLLPAGRAREKRRARVTRMAQARLAGEERYLASNDTDDNDGDADDGANEEGDGYQPGEIDNPALGAGKYSQKLGSDGTLGPVLITLVQFSTSAQLKNELNDLWRDQHPEQPPSLSLSKIRNLKAEALHGAHAIDLEVTTIAYACVYLERLCLQRIVTKANRRVTMAACLVLAFKFNEPIFLTGGTEAARDPKLAALLAFFEHEWSITHEAVWGAELGVLVHLKFRLHCPSAHLSHHFLRLLKHGFINLSPREYLGSDLFATWERSPAWLRNHEPPAPITDSSAFLAAPKVNLADASAAAPPQRPAGNFASTGAQWWPRRRGPANTSQNPAHTSVAKQKSADFDAGHTSYAPLLERSPDSF